MRRILVPLDGSQLGESILPDARRLAGQEGQLVLVHVVSSSAYEPDEGIYRHTRRDSDPTTVDMAERYLDAQAQALRAEGVSVKTDTLIMDNASAAIDLAARKHRVDIIACATHGQGPMGRLMRGGVAWSALAQSTVPVLLRHPEDLEDGHTQQEPPSRRLLVPLDGSEPAEKALPLARELAGEWQASLWLVQVIPDLEGDPTAAGGGLELPANVELLSAEGYLQRIAARFSGEIDASVLVGPVADALAEAVRERAITDVVMASHGRTGLTRAIFGSVADELIQRLHCPIIVIPALAIKQMGRHNRGDQEGSAGRM